MSNNNDLVDNIPQEYQFTKKSGETCVIKKEHLLFDISANCYIVDVNSLPQDIIRFLKEYDEERREEDLNGSSSQSITS